MAQELAYVPDIFLEAASKKGLHINEYSDKVLGFSESRLYSVCQASHDTRLGPFLRLAAFMCISAEKLCDSFADGSFEKRVAKAMAGANANKKKYLYRTNFAEDAGCSEGLIRKKMKEPGVVGQVMLDYLKLAKVHGLSLVELYDVLNSKKH